MRPISPRVRQVLEKDPRMKLCARRRESGCSGRITWEHALIYAGRQVDEAWAIIPLCVHHHLGEGLDKEKNQWIALNQASYNDERKYPKSDWAQKRKYLNAKFGPRSPV